MIIGLISYWACGMTCGLLLGFVLDMGATGLWWGLVTGLFVASIALTRRFFKLVRLENARSAPGVDVPGE